MAEDQPRSDNVPSADEELALVSATEGAGLLGVSVAKFRKVCRGEPVILNGRVMWYKTDVLRTREFLRWEAEQAQDNP